MGVVIRRPRHRVLYSFPRIVGRPGVGTTARHELEGLVRSGWEVLAVAKEFDHVPEGADVRRTMPRSGLRVPERVLRGKENRVHDRRVASMVTRLRPDLVLGWPDASLSTIRRCRDLGIPFVLEVPNAHARHAARVVHEQERRLGLTAVTDPDLRPLARPLQEYEEADVILVPSPAAARSFRDEGVDEAKLRVHRYGCELDRFPIPDTVDTVERTSGLRAVFAARIAPRKGLHIALEAWHRSTAAQTGALVVVGDIRPDYRQRIAPLLDHPSVTELGYQDDVSALMASADVLVLPSVEEGSALVSYEAQAAGCALLVSDAVGALVTSGVHGFVHPTGDVDELARHLSALHDDRVLLDELRGNVRSDRDRLSWTAAAAVLDDVLRAEVVGTG